MEDNKINSTLTDEEIAYLEDILERENSPLPNATDILRAQCMHKDSNGRSSLVNMFRVKKYDNSSGIGIKTMNCTEKYCTICGAVISEVNKYNPDEISDNVDNLVNILENMKESINIDPDVSREYFGIIAYLKRFKNLFRLMSEPGYNNLDVIEINKGIIQTQEDDIILEEGIR